MIIAVDFDGTVVEHCYPKVGKSAPGAVKVLRKLAANGNQLILWTMRSGEELSDAVAWFNARHIPLFGVNSNPTQSDWTSSPKAYAHRYIDDAAAGCPLYTPEGFDRPCVNWKKIAELPEIKRAMGASA